MQRCQPTHIEIIQKILMKNFSLKIPHYHQSIKIFLHTIESLQLKSPTHGQCREKIKIIKGIITLVNEFLFKFLYPSTSAIIS